MKPSELEYASGADLPPTVKCVKWANLHSVLTHMPSALTVLSIAFQIQYEITRVRQKMKDLASLHDKHMNRPTLDDSSEEEHAIEITTQEITQVQYL